MKLTLTNRSEITAQGKRTSKCCKPVMCLTTGEVFASVCDAADNANCKQSTMSYAIANHNNCKGNRYCFVADVLEHLDELAENLRIREGKVRAYDEIMRQKNATQEAAANLAKRKANCAKLQAQLEKETQLLHEAEQEVAKYEGRGENAIYC